MNSFCVLLVLADIEVRVEILGQPEVRTPDKKKEKIAFSRTLDFYQKNVQ